jgi:hypothetical protein
VSNGEPTITFSKLVDKLQQHHGSPAPPPSTDPLEIVIWENITYLASDNSSLNPMCVAAKRDRKPRLPEKNEASEKSTSSRVGPEPECGLGCDPCSTFASASVRSRDLCFDLRLEARIAASYLPSKS